MDTARQSLWILNSQHQRKERKVIQASQACVQKSFENDDAHPGKRKGQVKNHNRWQEEKQQGK